jgi:hypothetical protein
VRQEVDEQGPVGQRREVPPRLAGGHGPPEGHAGPPRRTRNLARPAMP